MAPGERWFELAGLMLAASLVAACATTTPGTDDADGSTDAGAVAADAAIDAPIEPDACVDATVQLLANGDFEGSATGWVETTNGGLPIIREQGNGLPFAPNDGTWAAIVGGFNNATLTMSQTFAVPADATPTRFVGAGCWVTEEVAGNADTLTLEIFDADSGAPIETLLDITNEDAAATCAWTDFEGPIASFGGATSIELRFTAATSATEVTTFAFDSLAVEATVPCM